MISRHPATPHRRVPLSQLAAHALGFCGINLIIGAFALALLAMLGKTGGWALPGAAGFAAIVTGLLLTALALQLLKGRSDRE